MIQQRSVGAVAFQDVTTGQSDVQGRGGEAVVMPMTATLTAQLVKGAP